METLKDQEIGRRRASLSHMVKWHITQVEVYLRALVDSLIYNYARYSLVCQTLLAKLLDLIFVTDAAQEQDASDPVLSSLHQTLSTQMALRHFHSICTMRIKHVTYYLHLRSIQRTLYQTAEPDHNHVESGKTVHENHIMPRFKSWYILVRALDQLFS